MVEWSIAFTDWIMTTLKGGPKLKEKVVAAIRENEVTGQDLAGIRSKDDLHDIDGIPGLLVNKLWTAIEAKRGPSNNVSNGNNNYKNNNGAMSENEKRARIKKGADIQDKIAEMRAQTEQLRKYREQEKLRAEREEAQQRAAQAQSISPTAFVIPIVVGRMQKKTRVMFESWDTVFKLKQAIVDQEGGEIRDLHLVCKGKPLMDDKTLEESDINGLKPVTATFKVRGGSSTDENKEESKEKKKNRKIDGKKHEKKDEKKEAEKAKQHAILRQRIPDFENNTNISPSLKPDCIMGFDEQDMLRVQMPCEHVFDPLTIYQYVESLVHNTNIYLCHIIFFLLILSYVIIVICRLLGQSL